MIKGTDFIKNEDGSCVLKDYSRMDKVLGLGLNFEWDKVIKNWKLSSTKEDLLMIRKNLILEYKKLKEEIETLEEFSDEFESTETIQILKEKQANGKNVINGLLELAKII